MSLRVWLPLNGTLDNQGLDDVVVTNNGATIDNSGKIGKCYSFDGNDDRIYANNISLNNSAMSACCWVKLNSITNNNYPYIFALGSNTTGNGIQIGLAIWKSDSKLHLVGHGAEPASNYTPPLNSWIHLCITINGTLTKLYVNGILTNTKTNSNSPKTQSCLCIGARPNSTSGAGVSFSYPLDGYINDFRLYDHALSPMEIKQISQGLVRHYLLNCDGWGQENLFRKTGEFVSSDLAGSRFSVSGSSITLNPDQENAIAHAKLKVNYLDYIDTINQTYTFSFDAKENRENTSLSTGQFLRLYLEYTPASRISSAITTSTSYERQWYTGMYPQDKYNHYERTFTTPNSFTRGPESVLTQGSQLTFAFYRATGYCPVEIKNIKLEKGEKATSWSPNSTDNLANLLELNNNVEYDCSGYQQNGMKTGNFEYTADTPKYNVSTVFNGSNYIEAEPLPNETKTISVWVNYQTLPTGSDYSGFIMFDKNTQISIGVYSGGQYLITYIGSSKGGTGSRVITSFQTNKWYHIVVLKTGDTTREVYINGVKATPSETNHWSGDLNKLLIGTRHAAGVYKEGANAKICDFRAYVTLLSPQDILSLYNNEAYIDNNGNIYGAVYEEE